MKTLIIDDQPVCYKLIKAMLEEYGICVCAASGKEAARIYEESVISGSPFDLVTLDISMPEMNGHETVEAIREIERKNNITLHNQAVKIIMTTGMDDTDNLLEAMKMGCEAYITKPVNRKTLLNEIKNLNLLQEA